MYQPHNIVSSLPTKLIYIQAKSACMHIIVPCLSVKLSVVESALDDGQSDSLGPAWQCKSGNSEEMSHVHLYNILT